MSLENVTFAREQQRLDVDAGANSPASDYRRIRANIGLGPYEVLSALGAGGIGEVYRATDSRLK